MVDWLEFVRARIADGTLLPAEYYARLDCDAALDARDTDADFDAAWGRHSAEVDQRWAAVSAPAAVQTLVEDIRRESFLAVSRATGQHEIAGYVADDLDLIVRGRLVDLKAEFLEKLWSAYERGEFPRPESRPRPE